jgi:guanosine-3',5'-bis(diphosphate) 3'-pyrophosphohydrolase
MGRSYRGWRHSYERLARLAAVALRADDSGVSDVAAQPSSEPGLVARAYAFARDAHRGQRRKDGQAFIAHPVGVARLLAARGYDEEVVAAALLHDVVEDTTVTLREVRERFGARIAHLVDCVTEDLALPGGERKRAYRERVRRSTQAARAICAADRACNIADLYEAASGSAEHVVARFAGGLEGQLRRFRADLSMLEEVGADPALREAIRTKLSALAARGGR